MHTDASADGGLKLQTNTGNRISSQQYFIFLKQGSEFRGTTQHTVQPVNNAGSPHNWHLAKLRPLTHTGQSDWTICNLCPGSDSNIMLLDSRPTRLCSFKTQIVFSDFCHFQADSVDFQLVLVKRCVWGTFKSDACYSAGFGGDLHSLLFKNLTLKSVTLCSGQNCSGILIPC